MCLNIDDLDDYYNTISKNIPISQIINNKSEQNIYANQKNIRCHSSIEEINGSIIKNSSEIIEKDTILAVKQNNKYENCNCFIGCLKHTIFKPNNLDYDDNITFLNERVKKIDFDKNTIISNYSSQTFDKIYVNTGPYHDQKILLASLENTQDSIRVKDSASFTFPIFYKAPLKKNKVDFGLTNYVFSIKDKDVTLGHAQIYPPINHINKSILPDFLWSKLDFIENISINRLLWVRCYLNDEYSQIKEFHNEEFHNNHQINNLKKDKLKKIQKKIFEIVKKNIQSKNLLPINFFIESKTSSHYSGDINHIKKNILKQSDNNYKKKIFFNDSLFWKNLPADSPTFTIMANALRNTDLDL